MRAFNLLALAASLTSAFEIPLIGGSSDEKLEKWLERAEKLAVTVSVKDVDRMESQVSRVVDGACKGVNVAFGFLNANKRAVELAAGGLMLFWGRNVMHLLLFVQTFRLAGLGPLTQAVEAVKDDFVNTTKTLKEEVPNVLAARDALISLKSQQAAVMETIERIKTAANTGTSTSWFGSAATQEEVKSALASARDELDEIMDKAAVMTSAMGTANRVGQALDPQKLQRLFLPFWQTTAACVATATSPNMAALTTSLGIGSDLDAGVRGVVVPFLEQVRRLALKLQSDVLSSPKLSKRTKKWLDSVLSMSVRAGAVYLGYLHAEMSLLFSGCLLGARAIVDAFNVRGFVAPDSLGDCGGHCVEKQPWWKLGLGKKQRRKLELREGTSGYAVALTGLASLGFVAQTAPWVLTNALKTIPGFGVVAGGLERNLVLRFARSLIWLVERPFIWADDWFEAMAIAARAKSAGMFKGVLPRAA